MIHIGIHTDNYRPLSVGFEAACEKIAATGLKHIEFAVIHGQNFIAALGYDPGVSLQSNPRAIRRFPPSPDTGPNHASEKDQLFLQKPH